MVSFHGSLMNMPFFKRVLILILAFILPLVSILITIFAIVLYSWWPILLIVDLFLLIISISLSGLTLKGHDISFEDGEIYFTKGWTSGRVPVRNLMKVYRVHKNSHDSISIIFNDPGYKSHPNRCLTIGQTFRIKDAEKILLILKDKSEKWGFEILDEATSEIVNSDKITFNWVPV